jgi:hypothetical protein
MEDADLSRIKLKTRGKRWWAQNSGKTLMQRQKYR